MSAKPTRVADLEYTPLDQRKFRHFQPKGKASRKVRPISFEQLQAEIARIEAHEMQEWRDTPKLFATLERKLKLNVNCNCGIELGSDGRSIELAEEYVREAIPEVDADSRVTYCVSLAAFVGNCLVNNYGCTWQYGDPEKQEDYIRYPTNELFDVFNCTNDALARGELSIAAEYKRIAFALSLLSSQQEVPVVRRRRRRRR